MSPPLIAFPICRSHDLFHPLESYPADLRRNPADEVYWLKWDGTNHGETIVRVARLGAAAMTTRLHQTARFGKQRCRQVPLAMSDWRKVEEAVAAAGFWHLPEHGGDIGLDGARWLIAGRRRIDCHVLHRWSPDGAGWPSRARMPIALKPSRRRARIAFQHRRLRPGCAKMRRWNLASSASCATSCAKRSAMPSS